MKNEKVESMLTRLLVVAIAGFLLFLSACPGDRTSDKTEEVITDVFDIPAKPIQEYEPIEKEYCVGQKRLPQFSEYDWQCQKWAVGKGECVKMPNPHLGNPFYCALCGLKGDKMVCYMINPE